MIRIFALAALGALLAAPASSHAAVVFFAQNGSNCATQVTEVDVSAGTVTYETCLGGVTPDRLMDLVREIRESLPGAWELDDPIDMDQPEAAPMYARWQAYNEEKWLAKGDKDPDVINRLVARHRKDYAELSTPGKDDERRSDES